MAKTANRQKLHYICTAQLVRNKFGKTRKCYRFNVFDIGGPEPRLLYCVNDICSTEKDARALEALFRRNQVSLCHVRDVLEDWAAGRW